MSIQQNILYIIYEHLIREQRRYGAGSDARSFGAGGAFSCAQLPVCPLTGDGLKVPSQTSVSSWRLAGHIFADFTVIYFLGDALYYGIATEWDDRHFTVDDLPCNSRARRSLQQVGERRLAKRR